VLRRDQDGDSQVDAFGMNDLGQSLEAYLDELAGNVPEQRGLLSLPFGPAPLSANTHIWPLQATRECLEHILSVLVLTPKSFIKRLSTRACAYVLCDSCSVLRSSWRIRKRTSCEDVRAHVRVAKRNRSSRERCTPTCLDSTRWSRPRRRSICSWYASL
jgi:hypothetical protein